MLCLCIFSSSKFHLSFSLGRSSLDENEAFLTTADSAVKLLSEATKPVKGWKGIEYRTTFPVAKPPGANFYPPDMDKMVFISAFVCEKKRYSCLAYPRRTFMHIIMQLCSLHVGPLGNYVLLFLLSSLS